MNLSQVTEKRGLLGFQIQIKGLCSVNDVVATCLIIGDVYSSVRNDGSQTINQLTDIDKLNGVMC